MLTNQLNEEGKREGLWVSFHFLGGASDKHTYINGRLNGPAEAYFTTGRLHYKGNYENQKKEGSWEYYFSTGELSSKGNFIRGKKDGLWKTYFRTYRPLPLESVQKKVFYIN